MKKKVFSLLAVLFFVTSTAFGQLNDFGIKVGGQSAGAFSEQNEFSRVAGFGIYGFADFGLNQTLFTTLDIGYTQRGFTNSQIETDSMGQKIQKVEATSKLSYISVTGFLNTSLSRESPFYFGAGPGIDYLIDSKAGKFDFTSVTVKDNTSEVLDDFVVGGSFIAGIKDLSAMNTDFRVELKYDVDFTDSVSESAFSYRNNALMLVIGLAL
jgi:hypothetical protein